MSESNGDRLRTLVSQEAARIIVDEGVKDYQLAKRKAASRLKLDDRNALPRNTEIEQALQDRQTLFHAESFAAQLRHMREVAAAAMNAMEAFEPKLTGGVLNGTASPHEPISLHAFSDAPEDVVLRLMELGIPYETRDKRYRWHAKDAPALFPTVLFSASWCEIEVTIFPTRQAHQAPISPIDGKPLKRADARKLEALLKAEPD